MSKRVFIIHGWGGNPDEGWFPWLRDELVAQKIRVSVLPMPDPDEPAMEPWISYLADQVGHCDDETYFVGHSIGCQTILRYLQSLPLPVRVGGVVLVAPWVRLKGLGEDEIVIAKPWVETPIHWEAIRGRSENFVAVFSDDDPVVYVEDAEVFHNHLGAEIFIEPGRGHFSGDDDITVLPVVKEELEKMMGSAPV